MALTTVAAAAGIADRAWKALEAVRERAQTSKDAALKANISALYDEFLALKAIVIRVTDENAALLRAQNEKQSKPEIRQVGTTNYYYDGDRGPFCQPCYDLNTKLINLTPQLRISGKGVGRRCRVCNNVFIEQPTLIA